MLHSKGASVCVHACVCMCVGEGGGRRSMTDCDGVFFLSSCAYVEKKGITCCVLALKMGEFVLYVSAYLLVCD